MQRNYLGFYPSILQCSGWSTEQTLLKRWAHCCLLSVCLLLGNPSFPVRPRRADWQEAGLERRGGRNWEQELRLTLPAKCSCCLEWGREHQGDTGLIDRLKWWRRRRGKWEQVQQKPARRELKGVKKLTDYRKKRHNWEPHLQQISLSLTIPLLSAKPLCPLAKSISLPTLHLPRGKWQLLTAASWEGIAQPLPLQSSCWVIQLTMAILKKCKLTMKQKEKKSCLTCENNLIFEPSVTAPSTDRTWAQTEKAGTHPTINQWELLFLTQVTETQMAPITRGALLKPTLDPNIHLKLFAPELTAVV